MIYNFNESAYVHTYVRYRVTLELCGVPSNRPPFTVDRTQHDQLAATVNQLEADNVRLTDESRLMADAASERETLVRQLEEEARSLHTR